MSDLSLQADQIMSIIRELQHRKSRFKVVLPEDLVRLEERLRNLHVKMDSRRGYELFYRIGTILAPRTEPLTMSEFSAALEVPQSTATRLADWLVESGYAQRSQDVADRRITLVALTEEGRRLYGVIEFFVRQRLERVLVHFTSDEREQIIHLLHKITTIMTSMMAPTDN